MNREDLEPNAIFTTNGKDIWRLKSFCMEPSCDLLNLESGAVESFGMGGLTAQTFRRITMPEIKEIL